MLGQELCGACLQPIFSSNPVYRRGRPFCSLRCARIISNADTHRPDVAGTAEELGIPVYEDIDPSEVTIYTDGTHEGPAKHTYRIGETVKGYDESKWTVVAIACPCGHYLRDSHAGRQFNDVNWGRARCTSPVDVPGPATPAVSEQATLADVGATGVTVGDDLRTDGGVDEDGDRRIHYRDICPDCGQAGESSGLAEIEAVKSVCIHHWCDECGAEWYCPTGRSPEESNGNDLVTDGGGVDRCRECGTELGAGYLCDGCDTVEGWE